MLKKSEVVNAIQKGMSSDDYKIKKIEVKDMVENFNDMLDLVIEAMKEKGEKTARLGNWFITIVPESEKLFKNPKTSEVSTVKMPEKIKVEYSPEKTSTSERRKNKNKLEEEE